MLAKRIHVVRFNERFTEKQKVFLEKETEFYYKIVHEGIGFKHCHLYIELKNPKDLVEVALLFNVKQKCVIKVESSRQSMIEYLS